MPATLHTQEISVLRCAKPCASCAEPNILPLRVKARSIRRGRKEILSGIFRHPANGGGSSSAACVVAVEAKPAAAPKRVTDADHDTRSRCMASGFAAMPEFSRAIGRLLRCGMSISRQILLMSSADAVMELKHLLHTISRKFN
jgi:hypothetical protein